MPAPPLFRLRQPAIALSAFAGAVMALAAPPSQPPQLSPATPASLIGTCEELGAKLGTLPQTTITGATTVAAGALTVAGQPIGEHCRVLGRSYAHVSPVDGKTYAISWEMRLPKAWNGRFFHQAMAASTVASARPTPRSAAGR
jgi:hypothetical protein